MAIRQIIHVDEEACTGCGECLPGCPEGALELVDGKVKLVSDVFCDGLGACLGDCPTGALTVEDREADSYDEGVVIEKIAAQGPEVTNAHLQHLREHGETELLEEAQRFLAAQQPNGTPAEQPATASGCPGSLARTITPAPTPPAPVAFGKRQPTNSQLRQWPVQITLVPTQAPYLDKAELLIAADCTPFAYPSFHADFIKNKVVMVGCPKLDDVRPYMEKLATIFARNDIRSIEVVRMEVPCCQGLVRVVEDALARAGRNTPAISTVITVGGERRESTPLTPSRALPSENHHGQADLGR